MCGQIEIRDARERLVCISRLTIAVVEGAHEQSNIPKRLHPHAMYALHAFAGFIGITRARTVIGGLRLRRLPSIIAVIMNYARREPRSRLVAGIPFRMAGPHLLDRGGSRARNDA